MKAGSFLSVPIQQVVDELGRPNRKCKGRRHVTDSSFEVRSVIATERTLLRPIELDASVSQVSYGNVLGVRHGNWIP